MSAEFFPHTDAENARSHFEQYGHAGLFGLVDAKQLEPALREANSLSLRPSPDHALGEEISNLRRAPDKRRHPALHSVLQSIHEGAIILGRDISPAMRQEKARIQLIRMRRNVMGRAHHDHQALVDVGAITNLEGRSYLWFEDPFQAGDGDRYTIEAGHVVYHDHNRRLLHRGYTEPDAPRAGLAITKS